MPLIFLRCFRFSFFLLGLVLLGLWGAGVVLAYGHLDSLVVNETGDRWHFGFTSSVNSKGKDVHFRGSDFPFPIEPGARFPLGHDLTRERILSVYVDSGRVKREVPCPRGSSFYSVRISRVGVVRCEGSDGGISRLLAALPVSGLLLESFLRDFQSLLTG